MGIVIINKKKSKKKCVRICYENKKDWKKILNIIIKI